jgi:nitrite reductase/ring-hydroxylating ferredoxin subunit
MSWVVVCRRAEVPAGGMRAFQVEGLAIPVLVADLGQGRYAASSGICPHEDVALEDGDLIAGRVVCPGHGYAFDMTTGRCAHDATLVLRRFPVRVVGEEIHMRVDLYGVSG